MSRKTCSAFKFRISSKTEFIVAILAKKIVDLFVFFFIFEATIGENLNLLIDLLLF